MADFQSKYTGQEIEARLDAIPYEGNPPTDSSVFWVTANLDFATMSIVNKSHSAKEMYEAYNSGRVVKMKINVVNFLNPLILNIEPTTFLETGDGGYGVACTTFMYEDMGSGMQLLHIQIIFTTVYEGGETSRLVINEVNTISMS